MFSSDVSVSNQLEWEGFKVPLRHAPRDWGEGIAGAGAKSAYQGIVDVLQGSTSLKRASRTGDGSCSRQGSDEPMPCDRRALELAHGGAYTLFGLSGRR